MPRVLFEALGNRVKGSLQYARDGCEEESTKITNADTKLMDDEASRNSTKAEEVPAAARRRWGGMRSCPTWRTWRSRQAHTTHCARGPDVTCGRGGGGNDEGGR